MDSGSTDGSVELLLGAGVRVLQRQFDDFAAQRNFGLDHGDLRHDWILHLDADEVVTPEFYRVLDTLSPPAHVNAYDVPSKLMLGSRWLRYSGMYPTYQVRLGRVNALRFRQVGHGQREDMPRSEINMFSEPYLHYNFSKGLHAWLQKHIRYASDEAGKSSQSNEEALIHHTSDVDLTARRRRLKAIAERLPLLSRPLLRFIYVYFIRSGWRDGSGGFLYALMMGIYEAMILVFIMESRLNANFRSSDAEAGHYDE